MERRDRADELTDERERGIEIQRPTGTPALEQQEIRQPLAVHRIESHSDRRTVAEGTDDAVQGCKRRMTEVTQPADPVAQRLLESRKL